MATSGPHISISAEPLFQIGSLTVTNSILTSLLVSLILLSFAVVVRLSLKQTKRPRGIQNFAEWLIEALYNFIYSVTADAQKARLFFPLVATFFLFIILNNWLGLLPGVGTIVYAPHQETEIIEHLAETPASASVTLEEHGENTIMPEETPETVQENSEVSAGHKKSIPVFRPGTADLNTTIALALISVIATQAFGLLKLKLGYLKKFFNFSSPILAYVGILELLSEFAKIISFAFRLFGNIFAGEVLLVVIAFLIPVVVPMPFYGLELFVGFIQALVFSMLSLVFFNMATHSHEEH